MRKAVVLVLAPAFLAIGADAPQRKLGPEWTRVGDQYRRKVEVNGVRYAAGNVSSYTLPLENDEVFVSEVDDNRGFKVSHRYGQLEVKKDGRGRVAAHTAVLGEMLYFDLNGDGVIDAMYDGKAKRALIFFEGRYVQVEDSKAGFDSGPRWAIGRGTQYIFAGDHWITK
jgi:hypothetical protein